MAADGTHRCRACGCALRHGHRHPLCDPCARVARAEHRCPVPDGFHHGPALRTALTAYDFGPVFRAVRRHAALSQEELGLLVNLSQSRVSAVERGEHRLRDITVIARVAAALGIPATLLGFPTPTPGSVDPQEVSWLERRDFLGTVTAITLGVGLSPDLDRLAALLPDPADTPAPGSIGAADVAAIRQTTTAFRTADHRYGGGLSRAAAVAQLGYVLRLQDSRCSDQVRTDLRLATADLAGMAAWMTYDVNQHDAARRLWMIALDSAQQADHPRGADLTVMTLLKVAHQALHLERPDEAMRLVQLATAAATGHRYPLSAGTRGYLAAVLAWCHGALGDADQCDRAVATSRQHYADFDAATAPPWATDLVPAEVLSQSGYAYFLLSRSHPACAPTAIDLMNDGLAGLGTDYPRTHAVILPTLAGSLLRAGDPDTAVRIGHEAVTESTALSSTRTHTRLRTLADTAAPFAHHPDVADLRQHIRTALAAPTR
jgi:transcriptional regulator with XRE-family HTH domain